MSRSIRSGIADGPLIARLLVANGKVSVKTMKDALDEWDRSNLSLEEVLAHEHGIDGSTIAAAYCRHLGLPLARLQDWSLEDATRCAGLLPESFLRDSRALPLKDDRGLLNVAVVDPTDLGLRDELQIRAGRLVSWWVMDLDELRQALDAVYGVRGSNGRSDSEDSARVADRGAPRDSKKPASGPDTELAPPEDSSELLCLVRQILGANVNHTVDREPAANDSKALLDVSPIQVPFSRWS